MWLLRLLSAPAPIPGCTYVNLSIQPNDSGTPPCFALPDQSRLPLVDFPINLPFEIMGIRKTLRLIICLLLEQKVSSRYYLNYSTKMFMNKVRKNRGLYRVKW
ncbi:unnamed protein product [Trichobilharzia regenti]|nr:unnamed protein product [Trichobilharzia regenti]